MKIPITDINDSSVSDNRSEDDEGAKFKDILNAIPAKFRSKTSLLLKKLVSSGNVLWDGRGVVTVSDSVIPDSNIVGLISDVDRPRKNINPTGWQQFSTALKDINIPIEFIGNPEISFRCVTIDRGHRLGDQTSAK